MQLFFLLLFSAFVLNAQPVDNPYKTKYGGTAHWTDDLPWTAVFNVTLYGAVANDGLDDLAGVNLAIDAAFAAGGGVVYFPAGDYNFSDNLFLKDKVILRGENPLNTDAKQDNFAPPSRLVFPKYEPVFSGDGTANSTAFKAISSDAAAGSIGLVYLDINRAAINLSVPMGTIPGFSSPQPLNNKENVLVFGVRNNNVATPDPSVPATNQNKWQRWCYRFSTNIKVNVTKNGIIANCRVNDYANNTNYPVADDSYEQPGYVATGTFLGSDPTKPTGANNTGTTAISNGSWARFDYSNHYGIELNRGKAFITYGTPDIEPILYVKGNEVIDNWVYTTRRIGISAAGDGLVIKGNVKKDKADKINYLNVQGTALNTNNSATLENRGIDWSGTNVTVADNDLEVYRDQLMWSGYYSVDGEGILIQECCGGSMVDGANIYNNKSNAYIGIYKMRDSKNISIYNNDLLGQAQIWVWANTNANPYRLDNVAVYNNVGITDIDLSGNTGGSNVVVSNNTNNAGTGKLKGPCYVQFTGNTGFTEQPCTTPAVPRITAFTPKAGPIGSTVTIDGSGFTLAEQVTFNGLAATSFTIVSDNQIVAAVPAGATSGSIGVKLPGTNVPSNPRVDNPALSAETFLVGNQNLVITTTMGITAAPSGNWDNILVDNGGVATLEGNMVVNGTVQVNNGGKLILQNFVLSSPTGRFNLVNGGAISIGSPLGITSGTTASGNIQFATRSFAQGADYEYTGVVNQVTGSGLPGTVRNFTVNNPQTVSLTNNLIATGNLTILTGTLSAVTSNRAITVRGNFVNNGAYLPGTSSGFTFNASTRVILGGTSATTFRNLTINGANANGDLELQTSILVNGTLTLTRADMIVGNNTIRFGSTAAVPVGSAASYIRMSSNSVLVRDLAALNVNANLPWGDDVNFTGGSFTLTAGTLASANVAFQLRSGAPAGAIAPVYLKKQASVRLNGISNGVYNFSTSYGETDLQGAETQMAAAMYNGASWSKTGVLDGTNNRISFTGMNGNLDFGAIGTYPVITTPAGALDRTLACADAQGIAAVLTLVPEAVHNFSVPTLQLVSDVKTDITSTNYDRVRTWKFVDAEGNESDPYVQTIQVRDNTAPVAICKPVTLALQNGTATLTPAMMNDGSYDDCGAIQLAVSRTSFTCTDIGTHSITLTVTDASGNSSTCEAAVLVLDNTAPVANCKPVTLALQNGTATLTPAMVNDGSFDDCGAIQLAVSRTSFTCTDIGTHSITLTVTDASGNSSTCEASVLVLDNTAPVAICKPVTLALQNGTATLTPAMVNDGSYDDCGAIQLAVSRTSFSCTDIGTHSITLTVTDASGNSSTCEAAVLVLDNTAPVAICKPVTLVLQNGTATLTPAMVNDGSYDDCGAIQLAVSRTSFTCTDIGTHSITLTVTDASGNSSTCEVNVTVLGSVPVNTIRAIPSSNVYTGGVSTVIYLGYGPQSVSLDADAGGGSSFTYAWTGTGSLSCTGCEAPVFAPTAPGNYSFEVAVANENGCTTTTSINICVVDIRVPGTNGKKIYVCHALNGNPMNLKNLEISINAVPSFINPGNLSKLGTCDMAPCGPDRSITMASSKKTGLMQDESAESLEVSVRNNPSSTYFLMQIRSNSTSPVQIRVSNAMGQVMESMGAKGLQSNIAFGHQLPAGQYYAEVLQNNERRVVKLLKIK